MNNALTAPSGTDNSRMTLADLPAVQKKLKAAFESVPAPIIDLIAAQTRDPFKILVGTILSARTKDKTTAEACHRLFAEVETLEDLKKIPVERLEKLIYPVGFFRMKAKHLKQLDYQELPDTIEGLCELPGVGRKTANLVVALAFDKPAICVDVHVHRITNRLGLFKTRTPFETEMELRRILPVKYWKSWNSLLVSFGQTRCAPRNPKCCDCPIRIYCVFGTNEKPRSKTGARPHSV